MKSERDYRWTSRSLKLTVNHTLVYILNGKVNKILKIRKINSNKATFFAYIRKRIFTIIAKLKSTHKVLNNENNVNRGKFNYIFCAVYQQISVIHIHSYCNPITYDARKYSNCHSPLFFYFKNFHHVTIFLNIYNLSVWITQNFILQNLYFFLWKRNNGVYITLFLPLLHHTVSWRHGFPIV